jgi:hypothetical protein
MIEIWIGATPGAHSISNSMGSLNGGPLQEDLKQHMQQRMTVAARCRGQHPSQPGMRIIDVPASYDVEKAAPEELLDRTRGLQVGDNAGATFEPLLDKRSSIPA